MFSSVQFEAYHPLHLLSYWLDVPLASAFAGPESTLTACIVHGVSLALWILALQQVFLLLCELGVPVWAAALGSLYAGVHPAQVEVVSWASARKDVLALLFCASSLRLQLSAAGPWQLRAWLSRALYVCALLSKTTALPLPLFGLCLDVLVRRKPLRAALLWQLPSLALGIGVSATVVSIWQEHSMLRGTLGGPGLALLRASQTLGHQLLTALWPQRVAPMYSTQSIVELSPARSVACVAYLIACVVAWRARRGLTLSGLLGFGLWLLPAANLVPLYFPLQDRYVSLPLFSLGCALAGLAAAPAPATNAKAKSPRRFQLRNFAYLLLACLMVRTVQYAGVWENEPRLWGHAVRTQPDAEYARLKLGEVRRESGDLEGAIRAYRNAILLFPQRKLAHAGLFEVVARRDERQYHLSPSRARRFAQSYYELMERPTALRDLASQLRANGYVRAIEIPLWAVQQQDPLPDSVLSQVSLSALRSGQASLARFYVHLLEKPPEHEPLTSLAREPYLRVVP
jgi:tetratricopeptide (TPR) repeat protein